MNDADKVNILRLRWRAGLHRLNGDEDGAAEKEQEAALLERYHAARDAAQALKVSDPDGYLDSAETIVYDNLRQQVRDFRVRQRTAREMSPVAGQATVALMHDFSEPSDEELLADAGRKAAK